MTRLIRILALLAIALPLYAYKQPVHRQITRSAFNRLGVDFEARLGVPRDHQINGLSLTEIMEQAVHDQDNGGNALHHFLDPVHDAPLTTRLPIGVCLVNGMRADDYANSFPTSQYRLVWMPQHYTQALLGPNPGTRNVSLAELFRTFGHVIHLVQDMAQPEHTRNDQHLDYSNLLLGNGLAPSVWEEWGLPNLVFQIDPQTKQLIPPAVSFSGYPKVRLQDYGSYFQTDDGLGMADFANRNFVTQDTNYSTGMPCDWSLPRCYTYSVPAIDAPGTTLRIEEVQERVLDDSGKYYTKTVEEAIYGSVTYDAYTDSTDFDPFHTFHSLLDLETRKYGCPVYSLGDGSFLSRASMLMPRAVGYSAGMIEHFFRGKIDVTWTKTESGTYDMKITNLSDEALGADTTVQAVYRTDPSYFGGGGGSDDTGFIINTALANAVPGFAGLAAGESVTIHDVQPAGLKPNDPLTKFERRIVVRGELGFSANEAIGLIQPPVTTKKLRAEITWPEPVPPRLIWVTDGDGYEAWAPHFNGYDFCTGPNWEVPNTCLKSGPAPHQPVTVTVDPFPEDKTFTFLIAGDCCDRRSFTITTKFYLDDKLVKTETSSVRYSPIAETPFAKYP